ncbi:MAG: hypothetical protein RIT24_2904 [Planctomycetota bacterium]
MICAAGDIFTFTPEALIVLALAAVGCALGSVVRDGIIHRFRTRAGRADLGILAANLAACVIVGGAASLGSALHALLVIGFAGGLSTWSALAVEVAGAMREGRWGRVLLHVPGAFAMALGVYLAARALAGGAA